MMRQAGRYLPEYRRIRQQAGSFLNLCFNPDLATEVTLQPVRRFSLDAAILFADILLVPLALGQRVDFVEGEGPALDPVRRAEDLGRLGRQGVHETLAPVYETVRRVAAELPDDVTLIGFCGAPWTVASYMVGGRGSATHQFAVAAARERPEWFGQLMEMLVDVSIEYLAAQVDAGADVVQIFESWAGLLDQEDFARWSIEPVRQIVAGLKAIHPDVPVIGFPRGAGKAYAKFVDATGIDCVGLDTEVELEWAREVLQSRIAVQGNLDPQALRQGGVMLDRSVRGILETLTPQGHIFNLGHGILPDTPIEHVERLIALIRDQDTPEL